MLGEVAISLFLAWFIWYILTTYQERRQMPPGPIPLPFIGNLHQIGHDPLVSFEKLREKYGDVFTVSYPSGTAVVVNSAELAHEALVTRKDDMAGRLPHLTYPHDIITEGKDLVAQDYGPTFVFRRKVFKTALHIFGTGVGQAEERVGHAAQNLLEEIEALEGRPFSPMKYVPSAIISEQWRWISSKKFSFDHPTVTALSELVIKMSTVFSPGSLYNLFPLLGCLPTTFKQDLKDIIKIREDIFTPELQEHRETYKSDVIRDLTDSFLKAYENGMAKDAGKDIGSIEDVKGLMIDVISAGSDTTFYFVAWFILYMLLNQDVQTKIHAELDSVVGRERLPFWKDADSLHYLQATICEVMRHSSYVPLAVHSAIRDTTIRGYNIPKGTTVFFNIFGIQRDPQQWIEAKSFRPDRFLDSNGNFIGWTAKFPGFCPFYIGRRACPGMPLGKISVFSFVSALLHRFKFELPQKETRPTLDYEMSSIVLCPKDYKVVAKKRM